MNKNPYLGAKHLSNKRVGELQRSCNFLVSISGLSTDVSFLIKGFPLPESSNEVITIKYGNSFVKLPGPVSFSEGELTIYDSISLDTEKVIQDWRDKVWDHNTDAIGKKIDFAKDATVTEYAPDGTLGRQWKLENVWPAAFKPGELAADSSDVKSMSITLAYDRAYRI